MNLAKILPLVFWMASAVSPVAGIAAPQSSPQSQPQNQAPAQQPPTTAAPQTTTKKSTPKPRKHKPKKPADLNCSTTAPKTGATGTKQPATNCPPPKTVVKNGGTSDPEVQITDTGDAAQAQQRSTTDQLLESTEDNLKKLSGRELIPVQKDMVSQIRQYMQQSKQAVTAGDTERGRMLAQKAQLLSAELVKP